MGNIKLYEVDEAYINYLAAKAKHLFQNKQSGQQNSRKYIGVVLKVNGMNYFAPLSSFRKNIKGWLKVWILLKLKGMQL